MPRPRKMLPSFGSLGQAVSPNLVSWAESLGEALGRGVARGINSGLSPAIGGSNLNTFTSLVPRRGRPPKALTGGPVPSERRCKVDGCPRESRSKGLCSAHYQAERRRVMTKGAKA